MRWLPSRQVTLTALLVLVVAVAGCSGGTGPADAGDENDTDATATDVETTAAPDTTAAQSGGGGTGETETTTDTAGASSFAYQWTEGESYTYEATSEQGGTTTISWTVTDVSDGQVTANITSMRSGRTQSSTFTGPQGAVFSGESENLQALTFVVMQLPQQIVAGHSLQVGNSWTLSSDELAVGDGSAQTATPQEITVRVTGTSEVAGTQCFDIEASSSAQDSTLDACVKEGWPFALTFSTSGGETAMGGSVEMTEFERP